MTFKMFGSLTITNLFNYATPVWNAIDTLLYVGAGIIVAFWLVSLGVRLVRRGAR